MDRKRNPFTVAFGTKPRQFISRYQQMDEIIDTFTADTPNVPLYMLTGVRGSGKTTLMSAVADDFRKNKDWIVIGLNINSDNLLLSLAAALYDEPLLATLIMDAKIDLSILGIGVSIEKAHKYSDATSAIRQLLKIAKKLNKRILLTIDDVTNNQSMREFCTAFMMFVSEGYPLFLLMTGLYENIFELQNEKSLTFLLRAPRIEMTSLNIGAIADSYKSVFNIDDEKALKMAKKTNGYSYAFQVLGYMTWLYIDEESEEQIEKRVMDYLGEYSYLKIWYELSEKDKEIIYTMAKNNLSTIKDIRDKVTLNSNAFSVYRNRLIRKGLLISEGYGQLKFVLPYFKEFVINQDY